MIARFAHLSTFPSVFQSLTGLRLVEFAPLLDDLRPAFTTAETTRHAYPERQRAPGAGHPFELAPRDQILLTLVWLRQYPTHEVLGFLFGVSDSTVSRIIARVLPLLEAAGRATMRMPDPGRKKRRSFDALVADLPELFVVIDSFEQAVQRPQERTEADTWYSGKKKRHTIKSQVTVNGQTGEICDISESVRGPTADITLLRESGVLERVPEGLGKEGDLAYVGIGALPGGSNGATPRRKPRGQERPVEDKAYNKAFSQRRIIVEHSIGRMRRYQAITAPDREHRQHHAARVRAVAGLVNRQLRNRYRDLAA
jgi:DDE superfamily endonuclease/Helix-turn-helix of DDE superfamily endonuclease